MNTQSFKSTATKIITEAGKPLHYREVESIKRKVFISL